MATNDVNPLQPYFLVYVRRDRVIAYSFAQPKQILEVFRACCAGTDRRLRGVVPPVRPADGTGAELERYNRLLDAAVKSIEKTYRKRPGQAGRGPRWPAAHQRGTGNREDRLRPHHLAGHHGGRTVREWNARHEWRGEARTRRQRRGWSDDWLNRARMRPPYRMHGRIRTGARRCCRRWAIAAIAPLSWSQTRRQVPRCWSDMGRGDAFNTGAPARRLARRGPVVPASLRPRADRRSEQAWVWQGGNRGLYSRFLFIAIDLADDHYTRTDLSEITRRSTGPSACPAHPLPPRRRLTLAVILRRQQSAMPRRTCWRRSPSSRNRPSRSPTPGTCVSWRIWRSKP